jgi:hypothetical protein
MPTRAQYGTAKRNDTGIRGISRRESRIVKGIVEYYREHPLVDDRAGRFGDGDVQADRP